MAQTGHHANLFDSDYFAEGCGVPYARSEHWLRFFGQIADRIVTEFRPGSVLDAGCALGVLVESLRDRGVEAYGVDISDYAVAQVREDIRPYCWVGSLTEPLPRRYDLIVCIEVLEHMAPADSERAIANLCAAADDLLISTSPFDYKEATHFNVQPPDYWAARFARHGFVRDVDFDGSFLTPWAVRYRRSNAPLHRIVADYERRLWPLVQENADLRATLLEQRTRLHEHERQMEAAAEQHAQARVAYQAEIESQLASNLALKAHLDAILQDPSWRLLQKIHAWRLRLAPPQSRRERWFRRLLGRLAR